VKYEGEWKKDHKYGKGIEYYSNGHKKYEGQMKDSQKHGKDVFYYDDGRKYDREFIDDKELFYEGKWKNGKQHSKGISYLNDGSKYVGDFKDGICSGNGVCNIFDCMRIYECEWKDDHYYGKGEFRHNIFFKSNNKKKIITLKD